VASGWPPLFLTAATDSEIEQGDGLEIAETLEALCTISKDGFAGHAGEMMVLRDWQKELLGHLFARRSDGRRRFRVGLIGLPRKNGKSAMGSALALDGLIFGGQGAEVYSAAAEKEQARIVFGEAKRMIKAQPDLNDLCTVMRDVVEVPSTNSVYRVLSSEAYSKEGLNISRAIVDELHAHPNDELWNVLTLGSAARIDPLVLAITTAGVMTDSSGSDSVCYRLFQYGKDVASSAIDDPSFFFAWWGAPEHSDHRDPAVWEMANPAFGDLIDPEDFESAVKRTPENEFRTKRLNEWVAAKSAWFPVGAWNKVEDAERTIPDGSSVVLAFDGSFNNDSTALVVCTTGEDRFLDVVGAWERPKTASTDWVVSIDEVEQTIRDACKKWRVVEIACDPFRWARTMQVLDAERLPVVEFPQSPQRMVPATQRFYEAVMNESLHHSGNAALARHVNNAVLRTDSRGSRLSKESKKSQRKIDLAVASVMAFDRAANAKTFSPRILNLSALSD